MKKPVSYILLSALLLISCNSDDILDSAPQLVVEAWIDDDGFPIVILTTTVPIKKEYQDMENLSNYLIRWAKVTVNDGDTEVVLTGKYDKGYTPPFIYTTGHLRGCAGKSYKLTVDYADFHAEATTTIPEPVSIDYFTVEPCEGSDTLYKITAHFQDNPSEQNYYKFLVNTKKDKKMFLSSFLGLVNDDIISNPVTVPVYRGNSSYAETDFIPYFLKDDTVSVKFAQIDSVSYLFWKDFANSLSLSRNPLFPLTDNLKSNISGGIGYWCGYGASYYTICITDSIETKNEANKQTQCHYILREFGLGKARKSR